jgi:two-component system nitrate/nitrite response regulator NarL
MTVEQLRTPPVPRSRAGVVARPAAPHAVGASAGATDEAPLCLVVPEIGEGEAGTLVRSLRRRESTHAVLLTRRAARRDLVVLLGSGVRGAVTAEAAGAPRTGGAAPQPGVPALTAREVGVLRLVAEGRSNREIGEELSLSALTVKSHLARISRKIGTGDRAEMVAYAIRHDLLR